MDGFDTLENIKAQKASQSLDEQRHAQGELMSLQTQETIVQSFKSLVDYLDNHISKTVVLNQLEEIGTPDALKVAQAVQSLHETLKTHENTDLSPVTDVLRDLLAETKKIPKESVEIPETKVFDYTKDLKSLEKAVQAVEKVVKAQKTTVEAPIVNVPAPKVNVDAPDLTPLQTDIKAVVDAVKDIVIPEYKQDNSGLEKLLKKLDKRLVDLPEQIPRGGVGSGGGIPSYTSSTGSFTQVQLTPDGKVPVDASVSIGDVTIDGAAVFSDSGNVDKKALVDADRHVQVDVLTMPSVTVDPPVGGATSAKQDTGNTSLSSIDGKITAVNTGAVVVSSSALPSGAATSAKQLADNHNVVVTSAPTTAVTGPLTDTQLRATPVPISGTVTSTPSGTQAVSGTFWQATQPVSLASVPSHAVTNAGVFAVQSTETQPATPTLTNVTMTGSSVTLQASNTSRRNLMVFNDSGVVVYLKLGSSASSTSFTVKLVDQGYYELPTPVYTGTVTALGASGSVRVTEVV